MSDSPIQELVCCMGRPVAGNPSQFMMERAFAAAGLDWRYLTLEVPPEKLGDAIKGLRAMGFQGANFAMPHNSAVLQHLDELTQIARCTGWVNCVQRDGDRLIGDNTNGKGFVHALREVLDPAGANVVVLGGGGVATAIAVELADAGAAEIVIVNRSAERGQSLVDLLNQRESAPARLVHLSGDYAVEEQTQLVINATSIGSQNPEDRVPLDIASLSPAIVAADVIFNPLRTRWLREAAARGCRTLDGLALFAHQGAVGFRVWTGTEPDAAVMRDALEEFLEI